MRSHIRNGAGNQAWAGVDLEEIVEARFVPLDALPEDVSAATLRRVAEHRSERPVDGRL